MAWEIYGIIFKDFQTRGRLHKGSRSLFGHHCQTPDLGQGLEFDFTFANNKKNNKNNKNNNNNNNNNKNNPTQIFLDGMVLEVWKLVHRLREGVKRKIDNFCKFFREGGGGAT